MRYDRDIFRKLAGLSIGIWLLGSVSGCAGSSGRIRDSFPSAQRDISLKVEGSSSMEKLTDALAEGFLEHYPEAAVTVQFTGSSAGIEAVADGRADIGITSRNLTEQERAEGLTESVAALDGIAVCVDSANSITDITSRQLADIYTGRITSWSALGGEDQPIVVIGREAGSGTREAFEVILGIQGQCDYANELDSTGAVMARVASIPGAIGYVSFDMVAADVRNKGGQTVAALRLDGIEASPENIRAGIYPLCRSFLMVTKGELSAQKNIVKIWFRYIHSEEGQRIAAEAGLVAAEETGDRDESIFRAD